MFARGFPAGVTFPDDTPPAYDTPFYRAEELAYKWHRLCDLIARNPLIGSIACPGWFDLFILPVKGGRVVMPRFDRQAECRHCRGEVVRAGHQPCPACGGMGTADSPAGFVIHSPSWRKVDPVLRWKVGRLQFGRDHPHFQGDRR